MVGGTSGGGGVSTLSAITEGKVAADDGALYDTVQEAENNATDWLFIGPGTFNENVTVDTAGLHITGSGVHQTEIDGGTGNALDINADEVTVEHLAARNTAGGGSVDPINVGGTGFTGLHLYIPEGDSAGIDVASGGAMLIDIHGDEANIDAGSTIELLGDNCLVDDLRGTLDDFGSGNTVGETV